MEDDCDDRPDMDLSLELSDDENSESALPTTLPGAARLTNSHGVPRLNNSDGATNRNSAKNANRNAAKNANGLESKRGSTQLGISSRRPMNDANNDPSSAIENKRIQAAKANAQIRGKQFCQICHYCKHPTHSCTKEPCPWIGVDCGIQCNALKGEFASKERHMKLHKAYYDDRKRQLKQAEREQKLQEKVRICFCLLPAHAVLIA